MSGSPPAAVPVWDLGVRLSHWLLVGLIAFSWFSAENHMMDWHRWSGYTVVALLVFRILWGFWGSSTARFANFVASPSALRAALPGLRDRKPGTASGHNPIGGLSVLALLAAIGTQTVSGLFAVDLDGIESGPLSDRVSFDQGRWWAELHETSFVVLQGLVAVHILAILFYLVWKRDNLIGPMITGSRRGASPALIPASLGRLVLAALAAGSLAWWISQGLRV